MEPLKVNETYFNENKHRFPKVIHLQSWFMENIPIDGMIYKPAMMDQVMFMRDNIARLFSDCNISVISTHKSKSILLPVYLIKIGEDCNIIMRNNFYDWKVTVVSSKELNFPEKLLYEEERIHSCYCEGFEEEWVMGMYKEDKQAFTVSIYNNYYLFTFLFLLSIQLNEKG